MRQLRAWLQASRLPSQSYLFLPLLLGQVLAWRLSGQWDWTLFLLLHLFGLFDQLYIVYANDVADEDTDRDNRTATRYSGGSRVLVEGQLSRQALLRGALWMAALAALTALAISLRSGQIWPLLLAGLGLALLWAYSFPPLRLSYRGGGEALQMLGLGMVLPLLAYSAQAGGLEDFPWMLLAALLPLNLAAAIATSLPDQPSDARAGKRTLAVAYGLGPTKRFMLVLAAAALLLHAGFVHEALLSSAVLGSSVPWWAPLAVPGVAWFAALLLHGRAEPGNRSMDLLLFLLIVVNLAYVAGLVVALLH